MKALDFGKEFVSITDDEIEIILHSCKTVLFYDNSIWTKKNNTEQFDIPMGSLHGAEACELVGLFLLYQLKKILRTGDYGLYRDDGLLVYESSACKVEKISKAIRTVFENNGFKITIETGSKRVEFLDVILDLDLNSFQPYKKENSKTVYVNKLSNHPAYIKNEIPRMINCRLNNLSKSKKEFECIKENYQEALEYSKYNYELKYDDEIKNKTKTKRNRKRKIIYFQPPFSLSVKTKIGSRFLGLVKKHFTPKHPL